jgi:multicomponent Na+:H+ antiporter subunit E
MYLLLFGFWVLLNGKWTTEIAIVGVIVCAALYAFMCAFMGYNPKKEWQIAQRLPKIIGYFFYLVGEIFKSAWGTMVLIWSPEKEIEPRVTSFHTRLKTDAGKVVLANSITMTPGTITVDVQDDLFLIHCLDESFDVGTEGFEMENRLMALEANRRLSADNDTAQKEAAADE